MINTIIIDTDILIDVSYGNNKAINFLENLENKYQLAISTITEMVLIYLKKHITD